MHFGLFLLTSASTATAADGNSVLAMLISLLPMVAILVLMYFIMIRPQRKKEKETQEMRKNIQIGDEVVTVGGIVGIVVKKSEDTLVIETGGDRSKIRVKTWAIQSNETIHDTPEA
ncbi:MAG TPA: preprotein translocase subunit YajC [Oscillospiraceae bacterium]|jgi:preprotein translocase subunit YajC|nr:preprotein translocase subunit YajC [Oscillospiraceae bacterium]